MLSCTLPAPRNARFGGEVVSLLVLLLSLTCGISFRGQVNDVFSTAVLASYMVRRAPLTHCLQPPTPCRQLTEQFDMVASILQATGPSSLVWMLLAPLRGCTSVGCGQSQGDEEEERPTGNENRDSVAGAHTNDGINSMALLFDSGGNNNKCRLIIYVYMNVSYTVQGGPTCFYAFSIRATHKAKLELRCNS